MDSLHAILDADDKSAMNEIVRTPKSSPKGGFSVFNNTDNIYFVDQGPSPSDSRERTCHPALGV